MEGDEGEGDCWVGLGKVGLVVVFSSLRLWWESGVPERPECSGMPFGCRWGQGRAGRVREVMGERWGWAFYRDGREVKRPGPSMFFSFDLKLNYARILTKLQQLPQRLTPPTALLPTTWGTHSIADSQ